MADSILTDDPIQNTSIASYYAGKSIFLTGGSGFIGKVIVEKLLRCCPDIANIYFLIRPKKGMNCEERVRKLFQIPLFRKLNKIDPHAREKVIPIPGDITQKGMGISAEDWRLIAENVNVVIHSAAAVRFNEPLRVAMEMNVIAVRHVLALVRDIKRLDVFCHISTAYSHCNRESYDTIDEKIYPSPIKAQKLIDAMEWMSDEMLNSFTKPLIGKYPNTYAFTKAITEAMLDEEAKDLPLVIIRPSIVCSSLSDPLPGWIDNYNGVVGIVVAVGKGLLRTLLIPGRRNDLVPVDLVTNCIITSVWYHGVTKATSLLPLVCNCTSGNVNPTTFLDLEHTCQSMLSRYPYNSIFRRPTVSFTGSSIVHSYWRVVSHYIPAFLADGLSLLVGAAPRFSKIYNTVDKSLETCQFFISNEWTWDNSVYNRILEAIPAKEKDTFSFDMTKIEWKSYYEALALGIKVYVLKDDLNELPRAKKLVKWFSIINWISALLFILVSGRLLFLKSEEFRRLWFESANEILRLLTHLKMSVLG